MVNMKDKRIHYNFISYPCTITRISQEKYQLIYYYNVKLFFALIKKRTQTLHILIKTWHFVFIKLRKFNMFITAVCVLFLIKP